MRNAILLSIMALSFPSRGADAATLFVADEGDGVRLGVAGKVSTFAGLAEYKLANGSWTKVATAPPWDAAWAAQTAAVKAGKCK